MSSIDEFKTDKQIEFRHDIDRDKRWPVCVTHTIDITIQIQTILYLY